MKTYYLTYAREQRVSLEIEAETLEQAEKTAWKLAADLDLNSIADESDDPGTLWLDDVEDKEGL